MKIICHLIILPSWILVRILIPFLQENHPWKNRKFSLLDWSKGSTFLNYCISLILWMWLVILIISLHTILSKVLITS